MKRFTETTKWDDPWFMDLPVKYKTFWSYVCDRCDNAGVWEPNIRLAIAQIGEPFELTEILRVFADRIQQLPNGKLWIPKFIEFQYGILSPDCKPHAAVIKRLESLNLSIGYPKGIQRVRGTLQEKEKEKDKDKKEEVQEKPSLVPTSADIYNAYPRHEAKLDALVAIDKAIRKGFGRTFLLERTNAYAKTQPARSRFTPLPASWFNAERFNDDPKEWVREDRKQGNPKRPWEVVPKHKPKFDDLYPT